MVAPARNVLDEDMEQDTSTSLERLGGIEVVLGEYYPVTVMKVDFWRDQATGKIKGWWPDQVREGKQRYPHGRMKIVLTCTVDGGKGDILVAVPFPWNDKNAPPWDGGIGADGKVHGKPNLFTDEEAAKFRGPIKISAPGSVGARLPQWAQQLGWEAEVIPAGGGKPIPNAFRPTWFVGKRFMLGKFVQTDRGGAKDWVIKPLSSDAIAKEGVRVDINALLVVLKGQVTKDGQPLDTFESVAAILGLSSDPTIQHLEAVRDSLILACKARSIPSPIKEAQAQAL